MARVMDICPEAARRFLCFELSMWCARAGARHGDIGARLGVTRASVSQMMTGKCLPSRAVLELTLSFLGASHRARALSTMLDVARCGTGGAGVHVSAAGWVVRDGALSLALESHASELDVFDTNSITPLLRSTSYDRQFRAIKGLPEPSACEFSHSRAVAEHGMRVRWVVAESTLDRSHGVPAMVGQLRHLVQTSRLSHVSVHVVPNSVVVPGRVRASFQVFRSPDWTVACQENDVEARYFTDPDLVEEYEHTVNVLLAIALDEQRSRDWIEDLAVSLQSSDDGRRDEVRS